MAGIKDLLNGVKVMIPISLHLLLLELGMITSKTVFV